MAVKTNNSNGLRSLELYYEPIQNRDFGSSVAYRSILRINDPGIGVLLPSSYLPVSSRSMRGVKLALWAIENVIEDIFKLKSRNAYCEWLSVFVPVRLFFKEDFVDNLRAMLEKKEVEPKLLCVELPEDILNEDEEAVSEILEKLQFLGVRTMLSSFGGDFCPVMRLSSFKLDFVYLDESVAANLLSSDDAKTASAISVFELVDSLESRAIATNVSDNMAEEALPDNCILFTGKLAGRTKKISSIRN